MPGRTSLSCAEIGNSGRLTRPTVMSAVMVGGRSRHARIWKAPPRQAAYIQIFKVLELHKETAAGPIDKKSLDFRGWEGIHLFCPSLLPPSLLPLAPYPVRHRIGTGPCSQAARRCRATPLALVSMPRCQTSSCLSSVLISFF